VIIRVSFAAGSAAKTGTLILPSSTFGSPGVPRNPVVTQGW
jgi:hypothetical protein